MPIFEEWAAQDFLTKAVGLISADHFWTQALSRRELAAEEIGELAYIGKTYVLDDWLRVSDSEIVQPVLTLVLSYSGQAGDGFRQLAENEQGEVDSVLQRLARPDEFRRLSEAAFSNLVERHHSEAEVLRGKIKTLEAGNWTPGDLTFPARCSLLLAASLTAAAIGQLDLAAYLLGLYAAGGCGA